MRATAKIMSCLSESKTVEMATQRDLYNISMSAPTDRANSDSLGCKKSLARSGDDEVLQPGNQISLKIDTPIHYSDNSIKKLLSCLVLRLRLIEIVNLNSKSTS